MAYDNNQKEFPLPSDGKNDQKSVALLPKYFRTQTNQKFLESTLDQMVQPGVAEKLNGFVGRKESKAYVADDSYIGEISSDRENYQLEPSLLIKDELGSYTFRKDYIDYVNQIENFGGNAQNQSSVNAQEYYAWNPNIDLDKVVNFREYYWLPSGPQIVSIAGQSRGVQSTYTVELFNNADNLAYIFSPDGQTQLPSLTLYRGQTYTFEINSEGFPFTIKTKKTLDATFNYEFPCLSGKETQSELESIFAARLLQRFERITNMNTKWEFYIWVSCLGKKNYTALNSSGFSHMPYPNINLQVRTDIDAAGYNWQKLADNVSTLVTDAILTVHAEIEDNTWTFFNTSVLRRRIQRTPTGPITMPYDLECPLNEYKIQVPTKKYQLINLQEHRDQLLNLILMEIFISLDRKVKLT